MDTFAKSGIFRLNLIFLYIKFNLDIILEVDMYV